MINRSVSFTGQHYSSTDNKKATSLVTCNSFNIISCFFFNDYWNINGNSKQPAPSTRYAESDEGSLVTCFLERWKWIPSHTFSVLNKKKHRDLSIFVKMCLHEEQCVFWCSKSCTVFSLRFCWTLAMNCKYWPM